MDSIGVAPVKSIHMPLDLQKEISSFPMWAFVAQATKQWMKGGAVEKGKKIFVYKCAQHHTVGEGATQAGPSLQGLSRPLHLHTDTNKNKSIIWGQETLLQYS